MLYEATKKLVNEANELKELCLDKLIRPEMLEDMDGESFELFQRTYRLMNRSIDLVLTQAELFDEMDNKLDKIMRKLEA